MSEVEKEKTDTVAKVERVASIKCHLKNPTGARRIIYDANGKAITVEAGGETDKPVSLSRAVVEELQGRNKKEKDSDLIVEAA